MYVDTSAIFDGRLTDVAAAGFLIGTLVVPRFVLEELQRIADSTDSARRTRGRRGLEILTQLQKDPRVSFELSDEDASAIDEVDAKLVSLARARNGAVLTTDHNLNRVAQLQEVRVLDLNHLANALKPAFLPGEEMRVKVIQQGKEPGQGVAYLDDAR
ncbi:MAG: PIN domain-containing protein [Chloroflexota bacterium]|nr:PIN domain-containing protein [Chloroflexota bacterium]